MLGQGTCHLDILTVSGVCALYNKFSCYEYTCNDQDDYWLPEKLSSAVSFIRQKELPDDIPAVYYANAHVADSKLNILRTTEKHKFTQTLGSEIVKRRVLGCTMLINAKMREILKSCPITDDMLSRFHDSLIMTVSAAGVIRIRRSLYGELEGDIPKAHDLAAEIFIDQR